MMSDSELHKITINRAKEEPVPASFLGVVLLFYQNNLRTASTKIMVCSIIQVMLIRHPIHGSFERFSLECWLAEN
jgi:hypothetical protein